MGYMLAYGPCFVCGRMFAFNPDRVPSIRVNAQRQPNPAGRREPICQDCVAQANIKRKELGLAPFQVPPGAYEPEEVL